MNPLALVSELLGPLGLAARDPAHLHAVLPLLVPETAPPPADVLDELTELLAVAEIAAAAASAEALLAADDDDSRAAAVAALAQAIEPAVEAIASLASLTAADLTRLTTPYDDPATWAEIAVRMPGVLLGQWLVGERPLVGAVLDLFGLLDRHDLGDGLELVELELDAVGQFITGPEQHLRTEYGWGSSFEADLLLGRLAALLDAFAIRHASIDTPMSIPLPASRVSGPNHLGIGLIETFVAGAVVSLQAELGSYTTGAGRPEGMAIGLISLSGYAVDIEVDESWAIEIGATGAVAGALTIGPSGFDSDLPTDANVRVALAGRPESPFVLFGSEGGTRLEAPEATFSLEATHDDIALGLTFGPGLEFVLAPGESDALVASVLGGGTRFLFDLDLTWSATTGLRIGGGAGVDLVIPIGLELGPVRIEQIWLRAALADGEAGITAGVDVGASLGPLDVVVTDIGASVTIGRRDEAGVGPLGSHDITVAFKPPSGLGLAIDVGVAEGGGYLDIDHEAGRYEGVLDLQVVEVGISAVAIIETDAADVDGWSAFFALYISIPSIQLGFGFALTGVGGVAGINRSIDTEALGTAVRSGALSTVLFPDDPIAEAPTIIDTFSAMFPPADGSYVFGPIIQIAWGTPSLIEGELGLVIQVPDPIVIAVLGSVSMALPTKELDLIAINIDVAGAVDFGAGTVAIDASVHNSHVIGFALSGDVALRASLRGRPEFLLSMGGFHPDFDPPTGFPALDRLSLGLNGGPLLEIRFDCYLALTSNTVQFGAAFTIWAKVAGFGIDGGTEFDAIVQFEPFKLKTRIGLHIAVTAVGVDLAGVWLSGSLEGPNPWHITGKAEFKVLGVKESIRVDEKIGSKSREPAVSGPELLAALARQLDDDNAWNVVDSGGSDVTLTSVDDSGALRTDPDGKVVVTQSLVPIDVEIQCFGQVDDPSHTYFEIVTESGLTIDGQAMGWFAPAQYFDLKPKERLSSPSFDEHPAGVEFGGSVSFGPSRSGTLAHEMDYVDPFFEEQAATAAAATGFLDGSRRRYLAADDPRRSKRGLDVAPLASSVRSVGAATTTKAPVFGVRAAEFQVADPVTGSATTSPASFMTAFAAAAATDVIKMVVVTP